MERGSDKGKERHTNVAAHHANVSTHSWCFLVNNSFFSSVEATKASQESSPDGECWIMDWWSCLYFYFLCMSQNRMERRQWRACSRYDNLTWKFRKRLRGTLKSLCADRRTPYGHQFQTFIHSSQIQTTPQKKRGSKHYKHLLPLK